MLLCWESIGVVAMIAIFCFSAGNGRQGDQMVSTPLSNLTGVIIDVVGALFVVLSKAPSLKMLGLLQVTILGWISDHFYHVEQLLVLRWCILHFLLLAIYIFDFRVLLLV